MTARRAWSVVDLGFGDAGKGSITDYLARAHRAELVVRFNGGAQAGHNVVLADGRHHTFSQLGAASFVPGVRTLLGPDFLLHPLGLVVEDEHLQRVGVVDGLARLRVHRDARVITPFQQAANQARERARGAGAHGTCGVGVGECVSDALTAPDDTLRAGDLRSARRCAALLHRQRERKRAELLAAGIEPPAVFDDPGLIPRVVDAWSWVGDRLGTVDADGFRAALERARRVVFEGAQGVLLDERWGFHPHTTWSDCTGRQVAALWSGPLTRLGLLRAYMVRHGAGPLPTEGTLPPLPEPHNRADGWQGRFRTGALDLVLLRYALEVCGGVDGLVISHLDQLDVGPVCVGYDGLDAALHRDGALIPGAPDDLAHRERLGRALREVRPALRRLPIVDAVAGELGVPVHLTSWGPTAAEKRPGAALG